MSGTIKPSVSQTQSDLCHALFRDVARSFPGSRYQDDEAYYRQRLKSEGTPFLLTTLPSLGRAVEVSLITCEPLQVPLGWCLLGGTRLPQFMNYLFQQIFMVDGSPKWSLDRRPENDDAFLAVYHIRQVCMLYSKVETVASESSRQKALQAFRERITTRWYPSYDGFQRAILRRARSLIRRVLEEYGLSEQVELRRFQKNPWGRHGPGAVAGKEQGSEKWDFHIWPGIPKSLFSWAQGRDIPFKPISEQPHARVVDVPKDFRGPRVICVEPKENQFAQQGIMVILYKLIQRHPLTRRAISFEDVTPSRLMCYDYNLATIDLKDASDRLSLSLARLLLPEWFFHLVTRYRSRRISIDGEVVQSYCLASMGNATCFPLETLLFWAIAQSALDYVRKSWRDPVRSSLIRTIRVFGDDIIVPLWGCDVVTEALEACGASVNKSKTCQFSLVRESCGEWVFDGKPVRIVRLRTPDVTNLRDWLRWLDLIKLYKDDYGMNLRSSMENTMCKVLDIYHLPKRYNRFLMRVETKVPVIVSDGPSRELSDYQALYAWHVGNDLTPFLRGARVRVKRRWVDYISFSKDI